MQHPLALFPHLEESLPPDVSCHRLGLAGGKTDNWVFLACMLYISLCTGTRLICLFSETQVFEDVVEILDPEMNIDSETGDDEIQVTLK